VRVLCPVRCASPVLPNCGQSGGRAARQRPRRPHLPAGVPQPALFSPVPGDDKQFLVGGTPQSASRSTAVRVVIASRWDYCRGEKKRTADGGWSLVERGASRASQPNWRQSRLRRMRVSARATPQLPRSVWAAGQIAAPRSCSAGSGSTQPCRARHPAVRAAPECGRRARGTLVHRLSTRSCVHGTRYARILERPRSR
jgi:hypothetical protein